MRVWMTLLCLLASFGLSRAAAAACSSGAPNVSVTNGRPLVHATGNYGTASCPEHQVVDVTYAALGPLPGTYLSWAAAEPTSEGACTSSRLYAEVWDMTSSPPLLKGSATSAGTWVANRDPSNPATGACQISPIRFETSFSLTASRKYRFAMQAFRQKASGVRDLVFANAPLPSPIRGCAVLNGPFYCALLSSSSGGDAYERWPASSYRLQLQSPTMRVREGGDLFFADGAFFQPHRTYSHADYPNFGYSNAALLYRGVFNSVDDFTCPEFKMLQDRYATPEYSYLNETTSSSTSAGASYCVLNGRNNAVYRMRVEKAASSLIVVGFRFSHNTGRAAWGCLDGMCDSDARIASEYMRYTTTERDAFVKRQFDLLHESRYCIEEAAGRLLPGPLSMNLHGERMLAATSDNTVYGLGGGQLTVVGFQGYHKAGSKRVEDARNIRFELHESMHVFNDHFFASALPSWLDEGLSVQTHRLTCGGNPDYLSDFLRPWYPGSDSNHGIGSELFKRLETEYACDVDCAYGLWRALVDNLGDDTNITNFEVMSVLEDELGVDLAPLFDELGIPHPIPWNPL